MQTASERPVHDRSSYSTTSIKEVDEKSAIPPATPSKPALLIGTTRQRIRFRTVLPALIICIAFFAFPLAFLIYLLVLRAPSSDAVDSDQFLWHGAFVVYEGLSISSSSGGPAISSLSDTSHSSLVGLTLASYIVSYTRRFLHLPANVE